MVDLAFPGGLCVCILWYGRDFHREFCQLPLLEIDRPWRVPNLSPLHQSTDHRLSSCSPSFRNCVDGSPDLVSSSTNSCMGVMDGIWIADVCLDRNSYDPDPNTSRIGDCRPVNSGDRQAAVDQLLAPQN